MKKQLFLASALALVTLASCGNNGGGIKVGLICLHDKNSTYDANFIQAFESACEEAKKAGKISGYSYQTDVAESSDCLEAAERFVNQGYSIIFSDSYGHDEWMREAARKHKNVFFCSATGDKANIEETLPNYHNAFASIYEGRYLAGVAAGEYLLEHGYVDEATTNIKLGYVGAFPYPEVVSGYTSWYLGVSSMFSNAKVEMLVTFTSSWYDYEKEYSAATNLIEQGCVLISQHADSMGAPNACKAHDPVIPNVSYNIDTSSVDPTCANSYVAHSRINWKPYYDAVLDTAVGSTIPGEKGHDWTGTLAGGSVEYNVSNLVNNKTPVEEAAKALKNGTLRVFNTDKFVYQLTADDKKTGNVTVDNSEGTDKGHITKYVVDINGNNEKTEEVHIPVMKDIFVNDKDVKYIRESEERSAPSFALNIEGITLL